MNRTQCLYHATILSRYQIRLNSTTSRHTPILKPPIFDIGRIVDNGEAMQENCIARKLPHVASTVPEILQLNKRRVNHIKNRNPLQLRRNEITKELSKTRNPDRRKQLLAEALRIKSLLATIKGEEDVTADRLNTLVSTLPNFAHPNIPVVETEVGRIGSLEEKEVVHDHVEIAESLDILDLPAAAKATGHAWYYLKGMGLQLELALVSYAIEMAAKRGWKLVKPPDVVRTEVALACGFRPRDEQGDQIYQLANVTVGEAGEKTEGGNLCLAGTAEIPLAAMYLDTTFSKDIYR